MDLGRVVYINNSPSGSAKTKVTTIATKDATQSGNSYVSNKFYTGNKYKCVVDGTTATFTIVR